MTRPPSYQSILRYCTTYTLHSNNVTYYKVPNLAKEGLPLILRISASHDHSLLEIQVYVSIREEVKEVIVVGKQKWLKNCGWDTCGKIVRIHSSYYRATPFLQP